MMWDREVNIRADSTVRRLDLNEEFFSWEVQDCHYLLYNDSLIVSTQLEERHQYYEAACEFQHVRLNYFNDLASFGTLAD